MSVAADMDADPLAVELRTKRICRMCLSTEEPLSDLYSHENRLKGRVPLPLQIMSSVSLEVSARVLVGAFDDGGAPFWRVFFRIV